MSDSDTPPLNPPAPAAGREPAPERSETPAGAGVGANRPAAGPSQGGTAPLPGAGGSEVPAGASVGTNSHSRWLLLTALVAMAGLVLSALLWEKLGNVQQELVRRSAEAGAQSIEARTLARQAQEGTLELSGRLALFESRLSEVALQRTQLEDLMQSLSRSRDENLVVDVESALRLAQQQAQLTGSAEPLLGALKSADQRIARAAQPRLNPLQRAIARDVERIRATTVTDVPGLLIKLDELTRVVDELPLANAMAAGPAARPAAKAPTRPAAAAAGAAPDAAPGWLDSLALGAWWQRTLDGALDQARGLLRVSRIDQPDAVLMAPEQAFFLRENLKLKLLNARLGLLSRQTGSARSDLASASASLAKYFDPTARRTQAAAQLLSEVQSQMKSSELPRLDETLAALATAAAGR